MRRFVLLLVQVGLIVAIGGFLLALITSGEVGLRNNLGSWVAMVGVGMLAVALVVALVGELILRVSGRKEDEGTGVRE